MTGEGPAHVPVLLDEVLHHLNPQPGQKIIDCTVGLGGHAESVAARLGSGGRLIAMDRDPANLARAKARVVAEVDWVHANFADLRLVLRDLKIDRVDGVLADLGVASTQLDEAERGFSFQQDGPLDMRMDPTSGEPASGMVARLGERQLADLIWQFGEERYSRRVASRIVAEREREPITTTARLAEIVRAAVPQLPPWKRGPGKPIDAATRTFQALRIAVNGELDALESLLVQLPEVLAAGGRAAIISFHSLEDRLVKRAFANRDVWEPLTKKPVTASDAECDRNPRSRSAKLRAATRR